MAAINQRTRTGCAVIALAALMGLVFVAFYAGSYFLAMHQDRACFLGKSLEKLDKRAVEECLFLYTTSPCRVTSKAPMGDYSAGTCVSYNILGWDPIHVTYGPDGRVTNRISAYE